MFHNKASPLTLSYPCKNTTGEERSLKFVLFSLTESVGTTAVQKPKRRAYLLKRKAITTGFFDSKTGKDDKEKSK